MPRPPSLKFKEKLIVKSQSSDALLKKMKTLHAELSEMEQETVDTRSLTTVSKDLIHTSIMLHRDKGVKAYAACCMADLLRLYAPDAPYTAAELKDMFQFFFRQLVTGLKSTESTWFSQYVYLLDSMATIKSVCLVPDLPHGDELTAEIFRDFFELVKLDLSKKVELSMSDILVALIEESPSLPAGVLDILVTQFIPKNARADHPTFRLAVDVCKPTSDRLQGPVAQYFADIIVDHGESSDDDEAGQGGDIKRAHDLIIQLNRSCPALLNAVVPQLAASLGVDNVHLRTMATKTLGEMFGETPGGALLASKYPQAWKAWITRTRDKASSVRVAFIEACGRLLKDHNTLSSEVEVTLQPKLLDSDEKVRAAVCRLYSELDYENALHNVSTEQLRRIADRILDRKNSVRHEAFTAIGKLYRLAYPEIESNDPQAIEHFAWIPQAFLKASTAAGDSHLRFSAEEALSTYVLPVPTKGDDEGAWTEQLLIVLKHLDESSKSILLGLSNISLNRPTIAEQFVQTCIKYNGGIMDEDEAVIASKFGAIAAQLSSRFPDHPKADDDLRKFGMLNESRLYKLMTTCVDTQIDLKSLAKSQGELSRRLEQASIGIKTTIMGLVRKNSLHVVNQSSIPTLVKRIQRQENDLTGAENARFVLLAIAKHCPAIFKTHVGEFSRALAEESNSTLVEVSLQALASVSRWDASCAPNDKRTLDRVSRFVTSGNCIYAKFATRLLAHTKNKDVACKQIAEDIASNLGTENEEELLEARLSALAELAKSAPDAFEEISDTVISFLLKNVLTIAPEEPSEEEEWNETDPVPQEARLKILAIKTCVNRCIGSTNLPSAEDVFKPVMRMLFAIIDNLGVIRPDTADHAQVKARLRLQAAISLLKLSTKQIFSKHIVEKFVTLTLTIQDQSFQVRAGFLNKLLHYLLSRKLDPRYNLVVFMTALDPEEEIRLKAQNYVKTCMNRLPTELRLAFFEMPLPRLLHLLAVHPDFSLELESLKDTSDYLDLYMSHVLSHNNIHLLTFLAQKTKSVRVIDSHTLSENLYAVSELAQHKIRTIAVRHNWATNAYPGQVKLPADIFKGLPNPEIATKIQRTIYLSDDKIKWLDEQAAAAYIAAKSSKPRKPRAGNTAQKRKSPNVMTRRRTKRRKKGSDDDSSSDDGEDSDDLIEDAGSNPPSQRATSSARSVGLREDDIMRSSDIDDDEQPRRNAPRSAKAKPSTKKKRASYL